MDPGLVRLFLLIKAYLQSGHVWWHMPLVLTMAYTLFERERLLNHALFDSYPNPVPQVKRRCNDPVLGDGYIGCFKASMLYDYGFDEQGLALVTPEKCVAKCKTNMFSYAALHKGRKCYCGMGYEPQSMSKECKCRQKCSGDRKKRCGGSKHTSLYKTYFCTERMKAARTIDGTCNDLNNSAAGSRFYRFGRNVPLQYTYSDPNLLYPNPRMLARKLLQRNNFLEVPWLNLFAVAWVQFMVHDWFDHGTPVTENKIKIPLENDDPLYIKMRGFMKVLRTKPDTCRKNDYTDPPMYQNDVTHWWDGSQLYGSDKETHARVRSFAHGKLKVDDDDGLLPVDPKTNIDITGFSKNWWIGLSILHNLFTREHNLICDMLMKNHPEWTDDRLFQTARLINTAQIVQIHTREWTGAILNTDFIHESLIAQWFGRLSPRVAQLMKDMNINLSSNSFPSHMGNPPDYRGVPFSLTEEFVSVYRMHSLLPDRIAIREMSTGDFNGKKYSLPKYSFEHARRVFDDNDLDDVLFTFGVEKAGQLVLHNYPTTLMKLKIPKHQKSGRIVDLATIDILRDRERGVPRYNQFRRLLNLTVPDTFEKLTNDTQTAAELRAAYNNKIENVDLLIGSLAEARPEGFGFGDTPFHLFLCMANRRLKTDRFLTIDYKEEYYTKEGLEWAGNSTMKDILLRNFPEVPALRNAMKNITNAFFVWNK